MPGPGAVGLVEFSCWAGGFIAGMERGGGEQRGGQQQSGKNIFKYLDEYLGILLFSA